MNITDELREWGKLRCFEWMANELFAIADRIDTEYQKAIRELNDLADTSVLLPVDSDGVPIHIGDEMEGVDKYNSRKKVIGKVITVSFKSDGIEDVAIKAWSSDGKLWYRVFLDPNASVYRHYHKPTVEDVLYESLKHFGAVEERTPEVDEWLHEQARRLRLADDREE